MNRGYLEGMHPSLKILLTLITAVASLMVFSILGLLLAAPLYNMSFSDIFLSGGVDMSNIAFLKYLQFIQGISLFILPSLILAFAFFRNGLGEYGIYSAPGWSPVFFVLLIIIAGLPVSNQLGDWNMNMKLPGFMSGLEVTLRRMEENAALLVEKFLEAKNYSALFINLLMIAVVPAIGEELLFRGLLQKFFSDWTRRPIVGILLAAFFFSFMHMQFYGFLPRFYLGVIFGFLYYWSGTLWLPIIAHFINNATAVLAYYYFGRDVVEESIDTAGTIDSQPVFFLISVVIVIFSLLFIKETSSGQE